MWQPYALEARYELTKLVRLRVFATMTLAFPVVFHLLFGVALAGSRAMGGRNMAPVLLGTYGAFGVIGVALFSFGMSVATERAQGWLLLKRATPMRPVVYVLGKVGASMAFSALIVLALMLCGTALAGVRITPAQGLLLTVALVVGSIPFCAIGLALGFAAGPNSAPALVNVVHLAGAFTGGLWMPLDILPQTFRAIAPWLPHYHLGQLALSTIGQTPTPHPAWNMTILAIWTLVGAAAAIAAFRRDEGKLYG